MVVPVDLALHLITVFCVSVNDQQSAIISVSRFLRTLLAGECSKSLCLAMCAASVKFSRNRLLKTRCAKEMAEIFANEARNELEDELHDQFQIDRVQCLAILAMFELNEGHNSQALYDLSISINFPFQQSGISNTIARYRSNLVCRLANLSSVISRG